MFNALASPSLSFRSFLIQLSTVILLWVVLFELNGWMFERLAFSENVSWIFLPAALRMIAVLLAGWVGVLGIFLGSLITCSLAFGLSDPVHIFIMASLSALAPAAALMICVQFWGTRNNLAGLSALNLLGLGAVVAGLVAVLHNIYFVLLGGVQDVFDSTSAMFVGDLIGTLLVLYAAKWALHVLIPKPTVGSV